MKHLTKLAILLIWLIGFSLVLVMFGFNANWFTFDTFLWAPFEMVLITMLGMLCITSVLIAQLCIRHDKKRQGDDIYEQLSLLAKHLIKQMKLIMAVTVIFIVKLYFLGK